MSWCLFDFANSSYSAVISAVVFPVYYVSVIIGNDTGQGDLWWGRAISASMLIVALSSPFLGGIADYSGRRKKFLFSYTLACILAVSCFSLLEKGMFIESFVLVMIANTAMEGGLVFYNSYLPEITEKQYHGRVSAWGYAVGYVGSIISLMIALPFVKDGQYDIVWIMVSVFFLTFSLPAFLVLPADVRSGRGSVVSAVEGGRYTWRTFREIAKKKDLRRFLFAFLVYEDGVSTVIIFSSIFAATTLGFSSAELIVLYMLVQVTALAGSFVMARPIDFWGPRKVVLLSLLLWSSVAVIAYFIENKVHFMLLASAAGLGLGTIQAASRAFFVQFIPPEHESQYFGVYSLVGKSSAIAGPLVFGYVSTAFGSQRPAILAISAFFIIGLVLIALTKGGGPNTTRAMNNSAKERI